MTQVQTPTQSPDEPTDNNNNNPPPAAPGPTTPEPGSIPLDPRRERYLSLLLAGMPPAEAYAKSSAKRITVKSAPSRASKMRREPAMLERLAYLTLARTGSGFSASANDPPTETGEKSTKSGPKQGKPHDSEEVTPQLLRRALVKALGADKPDAATIKAGLEYIQRRDKSMGLDAPDPAALCQWLSDGSEPRSADHLREVVKILKRTYGDVWDEVMQV